MNNKHYIYDFIKRTFSIYTFDRIQEMGLMTHSHNGEVYDNFTDYDDFIQHQFNCIMNLNNIKAKQIYDLCCMIENNELQLCDEESCAEFTANTIYWQRDFDNNGKINLNKSKLTIMNPR